MCAEVEDPPPLCVLPVVLPPSLCMRSSILTFAPSSLQVFLKCTHAKALEYVSIEELRKHAVAEPNVAAEL